MSGDRTPVVRCRRDVVMMLAGVAVLALTAIPVEPNQLPGPERSAFRVVNDAPSAPFAAVWVVMQLGNVAIIAVAAVAALVWRRPRLALGLTAGGVLVYVLAKVIKRFVIRGRPPALLADVVIRGTASEGLGFVSGHAAIAVVLAVVAAPYLSRRGRWIVAVLAALVCLSRVYVGAHLPLDVIGGAALGVAVGAGIRLILGKAGPERPLRAGAGPERPLRAGAGPERPLRAGAQSVLVNQRRALRFALVSLLLGASILALMAFSTTADAIQEVDDWFNDLMVSIRFTPLVWLAEAMAFVGSAWVNWPLRVVALAFLAIKRRWLQLTAFALAIATSEVLIGTLKLAYARPRPLGSLIATSGFSFPSGHAIAGAVTAVGLVVCLLPPGDKRWSWEIKAAIYASLMALSRTYLSAHWLSDVVAGALIGTGVALGWPAVLQGIRDRRGGASHEIEPSTT